MTLHSNWRSWERTLISGLAPVGLPQPRLVIALGEIKFGEPLEPLGAGPLEPLGAARLVQEGVHVRQRFDLRLRAGVTRHDPSESGFRASTTEAARPAVQRWIQPRSSRSLSWRRSSASFPPDSRLRGLVRSRGLGRCMGRLPVWRTSLMPRSGGRPEGGPPKDVCKLRPELCEGGAVLPLQGERGIGEP
jgi:hypothetical protein